LVILNAIEHDCKDQTLTPGKKLPQETGRDQLVLQSFRGQEKDLPWKGPSVDISGKWKEITTNRWVRKVLEKGV